MAEGGGHREGVILCRNEDRFFVRVTILIQFDLTTATGSGSFGHNVSITEVFVQS